METHKWKVSGIPGMDWPPSFNNQFSLESYADLKKYQDNTNSGLKQFTWVLSWVHASAKGWGGGGCKFFLEHLQNTCKLSKSSWSVIKKKLCTLCKLTNGLYYAYWVSEAWFILQKTHINSVQVYYNNWGWDHGHIYFILI